MENCPFSEFVFKSFLLFLRVPHEDEQNENNIVYDSWEFQNLELFILYSNREHFCRPHRKPTRVDIKKTSSTLVGDSYCSSISPNTITHYLKSLDYVGKMTPYVPNVKMQTQGSSALPCKALSLAVVWQCFLIKNQLTIKVLALDGLKLHRYDWPQGNRYRNRTLA